jgi:uncharacterized protein (DUF1501 family)
MTTQLSRRRFLQHTGSMAGASVVGTPLMLSLGAMADEAAAAATDYKALVCVFLCGGNDSFSMLIPQDAASLATSTQVRAGLVLPNPLSITPTYVDGVANTQPYGLHPAMPRLKALFDSGDMAIIANVAPMVGPVTKDQFYRGINVPTAIQSHNDQQSTWQSGATEGATAGWGGALEQTLQAATTDITSAFRSVSLSGSAVFGATETLAPYSMSPGGSGAIPLNTWRSGLGSAPYQTFFNSRTEGLNNVLEQDYANMVQRSIDAESYLTAKLPANNSDLPTYPTDGTDGNERDLGARLRQISRMIAVSKDKPGRQIFFVGLGGFDTHTAQVSAQQSLYTALDGAIDYFYKRMQALGAADKVTLFTASDFGRQLNQNRSADLADSAGTDHGWGSHHFIVGDAVVGKRIYGRVPTYARNSANEYTDPNMLQSYGMMLPQFSVDQYAATLGSWFGVNPTTMISILPSLSKYTVQNLGFIPACSTSTAGCFA